jgi:hypothetical protein
MALNLKTLAFSAPSQLLVAGGGEMVRRCNILFIQISPNVDRKTLDDILT